MKMEPIGLCAAPTDVMFRTGSGNYPTGTNVFSLTSVSKFHTNLS